MGETSPGRLSRQGLQYLLTISASTGPATRISDRQADPTISSIADPSGDRPGKGCEINMVKCRSSG
jgi:hypothetical protein